MYPVFRYAKEMALTYWRGPMDMGDVHVSHHLCWPWDVDPWLELNNGRTLTLYDLGRMPLLVRLGVVKVLRRQKWGMAVAGSSIRYRRRVRMFQRFEMRTRLAGWDQRFFYVEQTMWSGSEATSSVLVRLAMTDENGLRSPQDAVAKLGWRKSSPKLSPFIEAWIAAEGERPWPPLV